jgi:hypothetical protein
MPPSTTSRLDELHDLTRAYHASGCHWETGRDVDTFAQEHFDALTADALAENVRERDDFTAAYERLQQAWDAYQRGAGRWGALLRVADGQLRQSHQSYSHRGNQLQQAMHDLARAMESGVPELQAPQLLNPELET